MLVNLCTTQCALQYQELVEALEINPGSAKTLPQRKQSNTQLLAKAQVSCISNLTSSQVRKEIWLNRHNVVKTHLDVLNFVCRPG